MRKENRLEYLEYDPNTGLLTKDGKEVGGLDTYGYRHVSIGGKLYKTHRVCWYLHYGEWPDGDIDHINEIKDDNRIANLRVATRSENMRNQSKIKGYTKAHGKYQAQYCKDYKRVYLGLYDTPEEARQAYLEAIE